MMNALPEAGEQQPLVADQGEACIGRRLAPDDVGRALELTAVRRRRGSTRGPQQLPQRKGESCSRDGDQRAHRTRRMRIELELPPQLALIRDIPVREKHQHDAGGDDPANRKQPAAFEALREQR